MKEDLEIGLPRRSYRGTTRAETKGRVGPKKPASGP